MKQFKWHHSIEIEPSYLGDATNMFYPNITRIYEMLKYAGFKSFETVYEQDNRITIRAIKT